eukprot:scaffold26725_cov112-Isochrysis_galbana.AAC.2
MQPSRAHAPPHRHWLLAPSTGRVPPARSPADQLIDPRPRLRARARLYRRGDRGRLSPPLRPQSLKCGDRALVRLPLRLLRHRPLRVPVFPLTHHPGRGPAIVFERESGDVFVGGAHILHLRRLRNGRGAIRDLSLRARLDLVHQGLASSSHSRLSTLRGRATHPSFGIPAHRARLARCWTPQGVHVTDGLRHPTGQRR